MFYPLRTILRPRSEKTPLSQIWDIRRAVRNMSVMKMGGKDDVLLASLRVEQQIPLLNAEGQICEGRFLPPPEFGEPRTFAVEPSRESQV